MDSKDETLLKRLYFDPKYSTTFSSRLKLQKYAKSHGSRLTKQQVSDWLYKQDVYTSHHPVLHQFSRLKVITQGLNDVWDADLMDMSKFARHNDGIHYVAIFIDIFS